MRLTFWKPKNGTGDTEPVELPAWPEWSPKLPNGEIDTSRLSEAIQHGYIQHERDLRTGLCRRCTHTSRWPCLGYYLAAVCAELNIRYVFDRIRQGRPEGEGVGALGTERISEQREVARKARPEHERRGTPEGSHETH